MVKSFANALPNFILARFTGTCGIIRGNKIARRYYFLPWDVLS